MSFNTLGLSEELLRAVSEQGYQTPTSIQEQAIPAILAGKDIMAGSQTGTGKTAGFTLPMLQRLLARPSRRGPRPVRALILTPTRELADQVAASVRTYGKHLPLSSTAVFGGVSIHNQIRALRQGCDILIATPGRLLDHVSQRTVDLSQVEILVLDEADRMLDMGFIPDIRRILAILPKKRQNLLFSATFSPEIQSLADGLLDSPMKIEAERQSNTTPTLVSQTIHPVDQARKFPLLSSLITDQKWTQVLIFTRTKHGANRLADKLDAAGLRATPFHSDRSQGARSKALADFKHGKTDILVATDIAARGIDIDRLPHVVNYDLPHVPEDYVHRIGRTGRAGNQGNAVSLVSPEEYKLLRDIERLLKSEIPRVVVAGFEPSRPLAPYGAPRAPQQQEASDRAPQQQQPRRREFRPNRRPGPPRGRFSRQDAGPPAYRDGGDRHPGGYGRRDAGSPAVRDSERHPGGFNGNRDGGDRRPGGYGRRDTGSPVVRDSERHPGGFNDNRNAERRAPAGGFAGNRDGERRGPPGGFRGKGRFAGGPKFSADGARPPKRRWT